MIVPAEITIYEDRSFSFVTKAPPTAGLIRRELSIEKGSQTPGRETVATITPEQLEAVAKIKMPDLNTTDIEAAKRHRRRNGPQHGHRGGGLELGPQTVVPATRP